MKSLVSIACLLHIHLITDKKRIYPVRINLHELGDFISFISHSAKRNGASIK